ncbi:MAG TPA: class D sortase [Terriglobia bacterium]|nr:class D sortase [Terriglobia bacterium]
MRILRPEPKTGAKPMTPFSVDPKNLLALYAIRRPQPRVDLGEVPLRGLAVNLADPRLELVPVDLSEYPLGRILAESTSRRRAKRFVRWTQRFLLLLGLLLVGTCGWFYAEARVVQAYQGWRLDQLLKHRPAELKTLVESYLAKIGVRVASGSPPPVAIPVPTKTPPSIPVPPPPVEGSFIGRMQISRLSLSTIVLEGDSDQVLRKAAGHIPGTALPGRAGNVAIAGHRDTFFRALRSIREGDDIALETAASTYHYRVDSTHIVPPKDIQVLQPSDQPGLTLVTCYPFSYVGPAPKRYIVHARQIEPSSMAPSASQAKPLPETGSRTPGNSAWQSRPAHQAKFAHHVARGLTAHRYAHRSVAPSSAAQTSIPSGDEEDVSAAALSEPPADAYKPGSLRRRALAVPKRFASWFRSFPRHASGGNYP